MSILLLLMPISLLLALGFCAFFIWNVTRGQFEDLDTPAYRLLLEEFEDRKQEKRRP